MKKLFISADIEGTCGITSWDETQKNHPDWRYFADQMTREVAAACEGAVDAGYASILVKDAHDSARNLDPRALPQCAHVIRGWGGDPYSMMLGLDSSFDGAVMTGYHSAAGWGSNPLAHTMTTQLSSLKINGEAASELLLNALIAAYEGVPVYVVTGDKGLCDWMKSRSPNTFVVPVNEGTGGATRSIHPDIAVARIRDAVREAVKQPREACLFSMPERFEVEITHKEHTRSRRSGFYPGMERLDDHRLRFAHTDYYEVLRMMHFCL